MDSPYDQLKSSQNIINYLIKSCLPPVACCFVKYSCQSDASSAAGRCWAPLVCRTPRESVLQLPSISKLLLVTGMETPIGVTGMNM